MIHVTDISHSKTERGSKLSARIHCPSSNLDGKELWICYPPNCFEYLSHAADPWTAMLLWPAMRLGQTLRIDAIGSARLAEAIDDLMGIMNCWDPEFRPVNVELQGVMSDRSAGGVTASFFSGGVDSFHTLLKNQAAQPARKGRISHLIFAQGFDVRMADIEQHNLILPSIERCAEELGCTLVPCATNIRDVIPEGLVGWRYCHGPALAGMALGLSGLWHRILIPATQTYKDLLPNGSHPVVDPLWSTESIQLIHDGAEATRLAKVRYIATSDQALRYLRVCWKNREGRYNCGCCEKCVRTMISLKIVGALERCTTFDQPLSYARIADLSLGDAALPVFMKEMYDAATAIQADPALIRAMRRCLHPSVLRRMERAIRRTIRPLALPLDRLLSGGLLRRVYHIQRYGTPDVVSPTPAAPQIPQDQLETRACATPQSLRSGSAPAPSLPSPNPGSEPRGLANIPASHLDANAS